MERIEINHTKQMYCKDCGTGPLVWHKFDFGWRLLITYDDPTTGKAYANTEHRHTCKPRYWQ